MAKALAPFVVSWERKATGLNRLYLEDRLATGGAAGARLCLARHRHA